MENYFEQALNLAVEAGNQDEVPVGCVIVRDGNIISTGFNRKEKTQDPLDHAEIIALKKAANHLNTWRLTGCHVISTLEPCLMCMGALYQARVSYLTFLTPDPKGGGLSLFKFDQDSRLNHQILIDNSKVTHDFKNRASLLLKDFFAQKRIRKNIFLSTRKK